MKEKLAKEATKERQKVVKHVVRTVSASALSLRNHAVQVCKDPNVDVRALTPSGAAISASEPRPKPGSMTPEMRERLPPTFEGCYDKDVLRVWEFATSFHKPLNLNPRIIPSLQELQESVDRVDTSPKTEKDFVKRAQAIDLLNNFARNLCKPLSETVKSLLLTAGPNNKIDPLLSDSALPINADTWEEVARLVALNKAFDELGIVKTEQTYAFRGQGGGVFSVTKKHDRDLKASRLVYQTMQDMAKKTMLAGAFTPAEEVKKLEAKKKPQMHPNITVSDDSKVSAKVRFPSIPSSQDPLDWKFHIHLVKSMSTNSGGPIRSAVLKAASLVPSGSEAYADRLRLAASDAVFKNNAAGPTKNMALEVLGDAMGGEIFKAGKREENAVPRGPEVRDLFRFKGAVGKPKPPADSTPQTEYDKEAKRMAMQRGARRQTSFPANPLGKVLTLRELDNLSTAREKYVRKAKKFMKKRDDESDEDDDDDDDDDDDEKEEEPNKVIGAKGSTFIHINEEGSCEVVPGEHSGLLPIAQTTYVVNGNVEGYTPLDQER